MLGVLSRAPPKRQLFDHLAHLAVRVYCPQRKAADGWRMIDWSDDRPRLARNIPDGFPKIVPFVPDAG